MGMWASGWDSISSGEALRWNPVIGTLVMDSTPPATRISCCPKLTEPAAMAMACRPLEQKRLMVMAEVSSGKPPSRPAARATLRPCSPSGMAQPSTRSSTISGFDLRHPGQEPADDLAGELVGALERQATLVGAADGGANGFSDDDICHGRFS